MRIGKHAWSMQYHAEIEPDTVANWGEVPAYHNALLAALGDDGLTAMQSAADEHMPAVLTCAEILYRNFMRQVAD
jgi:hypothetical protein